MKKIAFFVEGQTESVFIKRLLQEIAGARNIAFTEMYMHAKSMCHLQSDIVNDQQYFALIVDCCSDSSVMSSMIDNYPTLTAAAYDKIICIRDLYPLPSSELGSLNIALSNITPTGGSPAMHILAVREVEAWFIQDFNHYPVIDRNLTRQKVEADMSFNFDNDCAEDIDWPADWLKKTYQAVGKSYTKTKSQVERTVQALDMGHVYLVLPGRLPSLKLLTDEIDAFLT